MRRVWFVCLAVFGATFAAALSLLAVSEAPAQGSPASGTPDVDDSANPYFQVVDNAAKERFSAYEWEKHPANSQAYGRDYVTAGPSTEASARFRVRVPETRYYSVWARWGADEANTASARFDVPTTSGAERSEIDQRVDGGFWVRIGAYEMKKGERVIKVGGSPEERGRVVADAVMIVGDALVGRDGSTASVANPEVLAPDDSDGAADNGEATFSARSVSQDNPARQDIVEVARRHLGTPYGHDSCRNDAQEDCSCHTRLVYRYFGRKLPDSPVYQWRMDAGTEIYRKANLRYGDLVFHDLNRDGRLDDHYADHVSIWAGNGNIVHASTYFGKVVVGEEKYLGEFWGGKTFKGFSASNG
jgi:cell wall-associated NlpC family hydrolase